MPVHNKGYLKSVGDVVFYILTVPFPAQQKVNVTVHGKREKLCIRTGQAKTA